VTSPPKRSSTARMPFLWAGLLTLPVAWMIVLPQWAPRNRGWPFVFAAEPFGYFNVVALTVNIFAVAFILIATFSFFHRWFRPSSRKLSLVTLLGILAIVALLVGLWRLESNVPAPPRTHPVITPEERHFWEEAGLVYFPIRESVWPVRASIYFGLACFLLTIGSYVVRGASRFNRQRQQPR